VTSGLPPIPGTVGCWQSNSTWSDIGPVQGHQVRKARLVFKVHKAHKAHKARPAPLARPRQSLLGALPLLPPALQLQSRTAGSSSAAIFNFGIPRATLARRVFRVHPAGPAVRVQPERLALPIGGGRLRWEQLVQVILARLRA